MLARINERERIELTRKGLFFFVLAASVLPIGSVFAEQVTAAWFESKDFSDNETLRGVIYFGQKMLRLDPERQGDMNASVIFRGDRQHLVVLDHNRKSYFILDDRMVSRVSSQLGDMMPQMEAQLAKLPPKQREMARRMMESRMPSTATAAKQEQIPHRVEARQETKEINGYSCQLFEVFRGKQKVSSVWSTREVDYKNLTNVFVELNRFSQRIRQSARFANFETGVDFLGFEGLEGFPILVETFEDGKLVQRTSFTKVAPSRKAVSFEPDPGYKPQAPGSMN